ncbi:MAG TPA: IS21 family transposase [Fimbriiglobus sp.]|jgi:transposase
MTEEIRHEIVRRHQGGSSVRRIAQDLHLARQTVQAVLRRRDAERAGSAASAVSRRRPSALDAYDDRIRQWLARYPDITVTRLLEELRAVGFTGHYTILHERVRALRPRPTREPVVRFETDPAAQAQMDYSTYDLDFTGSGRRRVHLFSYLLSYSRRQYLRFVESMDLPTTLREHVRAFEHLGGVARTCLYDNMKVVVLRHGDEGPLYNPKFLAFATHYGFTPRACRVRRSQTKGKVERAFDYVEKNLLNGRTFASLDHLNEVTAHWLAAVADVRVHRETNRRPVDRHAEERPHLIPLPATPYTVDAVEYRVVTVDGFVVYQQNSYSVPWRSIGQPLPVRITETELIVYGSDVREVARHRLFPRGGTGQQSLHQEHRPSTDPRIQQAHLRDRFAELGPPAGRFLDGLIRDQRYGHQQALKILALQSTYARVDLLAALERAVRFGAYSLNAIERILAARAQPQSLLAALADRERRHLPDHLRDNPVSPRPTTAYRPLVEESIDHAAPQDPPTPDTAAGPPPDEAGRPA